MLTSRDLLNCEIGCKLAESALKGLYTLGKSSAPFLPPPSPFLFQLKLNKFILLLTQTSSWMDLTRLPAGMSGLVDFLQYAV